MANDNTKPACTRDELDQVSYLTRKVFFKRQPVSAIIFAFEGSAYAYVNHCMHMHRPLNCEQDAIFDETGLYLCVALCTVLFSIPNPESVKARFALANACNRFV